MTKFCQACPNPAPHGERFCAHCEEIAINENLERFRRNVCREFSDEARRDVMAYMENRRVLTMSNN